MEDLIRAAKRPVVVIAHPDDESLWCAGLLIRYPKDWEVICCTIPGRDPIRAELFLRACEKLGARGRVLNQVESNRHRMSFLELNLDEYDLIVTHNRDGEYGHPHHKEVHEHITAKYPNKTICIGYRTHRSSVCDFEIRLTPDECKKKMAAIQCYDNISGGTVTTWARLIEYFSPKFDLWNEPYEKYRYLLAALAADLLIARFPVTKLFTGLLA